MFSQSRLSRSSSIKGCLQFLASNTRESHRRHSAFANYKRQIACWLPSQGGLQCISPQMMRLWECADPLHHFLFQSIVFSQPNLLTDSTLPPTWWNDDSLCLSFPRPILVRGLTKFSSDIHVLGLHTAKPVPKDQTPMIHVPIPLAGLRLEDLLWPTLSLSTVHCNPSFEECTASVSQVLHFEIDLSSTGFESDSSSLLLIHFFNWKPFSLSEFLRDL